VFANGSGSSSNPVVNFLCFISPMNYSTHLLLGQILKGTYLETPIMNFYGYTESDATCYLVLAGWVVVFFLLGWLAVMVKYYHL